MVQATQAKEYVPSRPVVSFCTALIIEALGSVSTVDSGVVMRILPFVESGFQPGAKKSSDLKVSFKLRTAKSAVYMCGIAFH